MLKHSHHWIASWGIFAMLAACDHSPSDVAAKPDVTSVVASSSSVPSRNDAPAVGASVTSVGTELSSSHGAIAWGKTSPGAASHVPESLDVYASPRVAAGAYCVVGALSEDGTDQQPYVALTAVDKGQGPVLGSLQPLLDEYAKARATRCLAQDGVLYVLLEFETNSSPQVSQTMLEVWKLDGVSLSVLGKQPIRLPGQTAAYSLWMPEDDSSFEWTEGGLKIVGNYFPLSNRDEIKRFSIKLDGNLSITPLKE